VAITIPSKWGNFSIIGIKGNQAESYFEKNISSVIISDSIIFIGDYTFVNKQLTSITIPNNIISIRNSAFASNQLTGVTIPNSVTSIGNSAFANNPISSITLPANLNLSNNQNTSAFPNEFDAFYYSNGAKAGIYTLRNGVYWSYAMR
jgi:hypothetical protein